MQNQQLDTKLIGNKYNRLTIVKYVGSASRGRLFEFKCDCGTVIIRPVTTVVRGNVKSCGCIKHQSRKLMERNPVSKLKDEDIIKIVKISERITGVLQHFKINKTPNNINALRKRIKKLNINCDHFPKTTKGIKKNEQRVDSEELFSIYGRGCFHRSEQVKTRFLELVPYQCVLCKNKGKWQDENLILQMDHINGDNKDNRLENLRLLCPNCHSQTVTYAKRKMSKEESAKITGVPILQLSIDGKIIKEWPSISSVSSKIPNSRGGISKCLQGRYQSAYGYFWAYKHEYESGKFVLPEYRRQTMLDNLKRRQETDKILVA